MTPGATDFDALLVRVQSEYLEMPGLSVNVQQASRLWNTEQEIAKELPGRLVLTQFLRRRENGSLVRVL
jgi:hypothetical protein